MAENISELAVRMQAKLGRAGFIDLCITATNKALVKKGLLTEQELIDSFKEEAAALDKDLASVKAVIFKPLKDPEGCSVYTLPNWLEAVNLGMFIDYDGFGYYATEKEESSIMVIPSDVISSSFKSPDWATHVVWYNR